MAERQFGPYRLVHQIAVGGMAEIHLAKTGGIAGFEKYVALKMIHPNFSEDEQFIQMLIDEAKITVQLQHVNIAQTFDLGRVGDNFYITMEYVDGCDLYQLLRRSSEQDIYTPVDIAAFVAKEVATGLDYAHRKRDHSGNPLGIVHRDVSPQNVLISHAGEVKLVDFGIAKATMRARQTAVGVIKGKYYYMSPEQAWGDRVDHRSDIFSAGILIYEMLTGQMLYLEDDVNRLLGMVRKANIAPPSELRKGIPPQLERIVMHCLQKHPDDRYRTAADLATDLERFLHVYSPVFTASKLAKHVTEIMEVELTPPPEDPTIAEGMRSARRVTKRVQDSELVRSRSEFSDENSVIFRVQDMVRPLAESDEPLEDDPAADPEPEREPEPPEEPRSPRLAQSLTRSIPADDFSDDRTIIDDSPPLFGRASADPGTAERLIDGETTAMSALDPSADDDAPTMAIEAHEIAQASSRGHGDERALDAKTERRTRKIPLAAANEALAANNPRPAVSQVRQPRKSRRTPGQGLPAVPGKLPITAEPSRPAGSVISALISDAIGTSPTQQRGPGSLIPPSIEEQPTVDHVKPLPRREDPFAPLADSVDLPRTPPPGQPLADDFGPRVLADLEVDALPDAYKVGRGGMPSWLWRVAIVFVAIVIGVMIGLFMLGDEAAPVTASMEIVSIPEGATVSIDGQPQAGRTPMVLRDVQPGSEYRIVIQLDGYRVWDRREPVPLDGGQVKVIASLKPVVVTLHLESTPANAEVFLNGRSVGRTPLTLTQLEPSAARIVELRAPGYAPERRTLDWTDKTEQRQQFTLQK